MEKALERVRLEKADLLLVSGDLFHRQPLVRELKEVNYLFSTIPDTTVVLMAGNHDYIKKGSYYPEFPWNKNVIGLWNRECVRVSIPKKNVCVYGCSYYSREVTDDLYQNVRPSGREAFHILLAHGGDEKHSPVNRERLAEAGFQYAALGHIHKAQRIGGREAVRYAGSPLPMSFSEKNYRHQVIAVEIEEGKVTEIEAIGIPRVADLMRIPDSPLPPEEVLRCLAGLPEPEEGREDESRWPYLEIRVLLTEPDPTFRHRVEEALVGKAVRLTSIVPSYPRREGEAEERALSYNDLQKIAPLDMLRHTFAARYGGELPEEIETLFNEVMREVSL